MTPLFEEVQRPASGFVGVMGFLLGALLLGFRLFVIPEASLWPAVVAPVTVLVFGALVDMRTTVTPDELRVRMRPFERRVPIQQIVECEVVTYRPLIDYGGWGRTWTPWGGSAYTMRGNRGVRVRTRTRRPFVVGSQRPEELAAALTSALAPKPDRPPGA